MIEIYQQVQKQKTNPVVDFVAGEFKGEVVATLPNRQDHCEQCGDALGSFVLQIGPIFSNRHVCSINCLDAYDRGLE